jgi:hypothetical protein
MERILVEGDETFHRGLKEFYTSGQGIFFGFDQDIRRRVFTEVIKKDYFSKILFFKIISTFFNTPVEILF